MKGNTAMRYRKNKMSPERKRAGTIGQNFVHEPLKITGAPYDKGTVKWRAVLASASPSAEGQITSASKICEAYRKIGTTIGTQHIACLIMDGCLSFMNKDVRLQPGGSAYLVIPTKEAMAHNSNNKKGPVSEAREWMATAIAQGLEAGMSTEMIRIMFQEELDR